MVSAPYLRHAALVNLYLIHFQELGEKERDIKGSLEDLKDRLFQGRTPRALTPRVF